MGSQNLSNFQSSLNLDTHIHNFHPGPTCHSPLFFSPAFVRIAAPVLFPWVARGRTHNGRKPTALPSRDGAGGCRGRNRGGRRRTRGPCSSSSPHLAKAALGSGRGRRGQDLAISLGRGRRRWLWEAGDDAICRIRRGRGAAGPDSAVSPGGIGGGPVGGGARASARGWGPADDAGGRGGEEDERRRSAALRATEAAVVSSFDLGGDRRPRGSSVGDREARW